MFLDPEALEDKRLWSLPRVHGLGYISHGLRAGASSVLLVAQNPPPKTEPILLQSHLPITPQDLDM